MTYFTNSNVQDVADAITEAEDKLRALRETPLEDALDQVEGIAEAIHEIEVQLKYVDSDIEDYEAAQEFLEEAGGEGINDAYDLRELIEEKDELFERVKELEATVTDKAEVEQLQTQVTNLTHWHDNQGMVIRALLERLSQVDALVNSDTIGTLIFESTQQKGMVLITDENGE